MKTVGEQCMIEFLESFVKSQKATIETEKCEYIKMLNEVEILMYEDFKVIHIPNDNIMTLHFNGSEIPCAMKY